MERDRTNTQRVAQDVVVQDIEEHVEIWERYRVPHMTLDTMQVRALVDEIRRLRAAITHHNPIHGAQEPIGQS